MAGLTVEDALEAGECMNRMLAKCGKYETRYMYCSDEFAKLHLPAAELARYVETQNTLGSTEYRINRARNLLSGIKDERIANTFDMLGKIESLRGEKLESYDKEKSQIFTEIGVDYEAFIDEQQRLLSNVGEMLRGDARPIETPLTDAVNSWEARNPEKARHSDEISANRLRLLTEMDSALKDNFDRAISEISKYLSGQREIDGSQPGGAGQA